MKGVLEINGKKFYSIKEATASVSYSRDHITKLAREEKIKATHIGRHWYVDLDSLKKYEEIATAESEIRKKQLSTQRKRERLMRERFFEREQSLFNRSKKFNPVAASFAGMVMIAGVTTGAVLFGSGIGSSSTANQAALPAINSTTYDPESGGFDGEILEAKFVHKRTSVDLKGYESGILLLPNASAERIISVEQYFSDPVQVKVSDVGQKVIVRVDEEGNERGPEIPFVTVPVNQPSE